MYICPVCGKNLKPSKNVCRCRNGHCFDIARNGYINLLTTKGRNPKKAGDNPLMVKARSSFLDKGYYRPLAVKAAEIIKALLNGKEQPVIIDSGCGEGYYTSFYACELKNAEIYGIDLSKSAVSHCAARSRQNGLANVSFAVASAFELPFRALSTDLIVSAFAPVSNDEYTRVLKKGGFLVIISPAARHLYGLKSVLYDEPYENRPNAYGLRKFAKIQEEEITYSVTLSSNEDIRNLFAMTPYFYKTPEESGSRLEALEALETECSFLIEAYRKK
ncbi:methyltransferase domain-containing protein [Ruminococcus sp. Marseille-P6503]|uniref:methyltransferase domain-containing protein n=1 Tax=Ruminococcus sp. Marseille-P6503 TaxID=2364796 RepID=UPI000F52A265|nr:methyltransferase domain-containing protein [Ruminococcus sp. Marseille-P6503]